MNGRNDFPPWIILELRPRTKSIRFCVIELAKPVLSELLKSGKIDTADYGFTLDGAELNFAVTRREGVSEEQINELLEEVAEKYSDKIDTHVVAPYAFLSMNSFGGEELFGLITRLNSELANSCLSLYSCAEDGEKTDLFIFALVCTLLILEPFGLDEDEYRSIFDNRLNDPAMADLDPERRVAIVKNLVSNNPVFGECFQDLTIDWNRLQEFLSETQVSILEELKKNLEHLVSGLGLRTLMRDQAFIKALSKRAIHLLWLRLGLSNEKELIGIELLSNFRQKVSS
jgi:hypothetical protein